MNKVLQKVLLGMTLTAIFGGGATLAKADDVNTSSDSSGVNNVLANDSNSTQSTQASKTSLADQISSTSQAAQVLTKLQAATSTSESSSTSYLNAETSSTNQTTTRNVEEPSSNTDSSSSSSSVAEIATSSATASVGSDTASQASQTGKVLADGSANADTVKKAPRNNNTQAAKQAASTLATTMKGASQNNLTFYNDADEAVVGFNGNNIYNRGYNYSYDNLDAVKYSGDTRDDKAQVINDYANLTDSELKEVNFFAAQLLNTARQSVWAVNGQDSNSWQLMITKDSLGLAVKVAQGYTRNRHSISTGTHDIAVLKQAYSSYGLHGYSEDYGSTLLNYAATMTTNRKTTMYDLKRAVFQTLTLMLYDDMPATSGGSNAGADGNGHAYSLAYGWDQYSFGANYFGLAFDQMGQVHIVNFRPSMIWRDTRFDTNQLVYTKTLGNTSVLTKNVPTAYSNYLKASVFNNDSSISYVKEKVVGNTAYYFVTRNGQQYIYDSNLTKLKGQVKIGGTLYNLSNSTGIVLKNNSEITATEVAQRLASNQNVAYFDSVSIDGTNMIVSGWHAADASIIRPYSYIILFDKTMNRELRRVAYMANYRGDVARVYPALYRSANSGFRVVFNLQGLNYAGHQLQLVARYSDDVAGNGNTTDVWSSDYTFNTNAACFDSVKIEGTNLLVRGWHIADAAANRKYAYIILFDKSANRELRRIAYNPTNRSDVARVYHNVYNGANGGFDVSFDLRGLDFAGHQLQIVARYTDDVAGNGNAMDVWSGDYTFNSNAGYLDSVKKVNDKTINVSGWHVADAASRQKYTWIIVLDKTLGREIARTKYVQSTRNDVYTYYSGSYNARQSGFSNVNVQLSTNLSGLNNHVLQVVARYSDNSYSGEGHYTDFYSKDVRFRNGMFYL
ncbi:hypothetical protein SN811_09860 [Ligilactobacillus agilis]|uniref:Uncharacterized protein n=1 Tax=Ligilactobacillus agilis TaxID=1601 RepID=A0A6F9Y4R0_9LACO|nr:SEC10/PgrA surface exclusion domain-containing protein [Ligilactobacillus agilis]GET12486.1 hypothetical protein SN811_09860 [Ligilactobacillus agilis]